MAQHLDTKITKLPIEAQYDTLIKIKSELGLVFEVPQKAFCVASTAASAGS